MSVQIQHFVTSQDQHISDLYATVLAAIVLADGAQGLTAPKSQFFRLLLEVYGIQQSSAVYFEQAIRLNHQTLTVFYRGMDQEIFQQIAVFDALLLTCCDEPLTAPRSILVTEFIKSIGLGDADLNWLVQAVRLTLGLPIQIWSPDFVANIDHLSKKHPLLHAAFKSYWTATRQLASGVYVNTQHQLMWMRCSVGQQMHDGDCIGNGSRMSWDEANAVCKDVSLLGYHDWRLPTLSELKTLIQYEIKEDIEPKPQLAIAGTRSWWNTINAFTPVSRVITHAGYACPESALFMPISNCFGKYWTMQTDTKRVDKHWVIDFGRPNYSPTRRFRTNKQYKRRYVRLVRTI